MRRPAMKKMGGKGGAIRQANAPEFGADFGCLGTKSGKGFGCLGVMSNKYGRKWRTKQQSHPISCAKAHRFWRPLGGPF